jgi:hypothetical protein
MMRAAARVRDACDMPEISAKTVRLSRGRHARPEDGACVVELASMLAGEAFTDRPRNVSPVVAAFLRGYNDGVGDRRRQDLYPLAAEIVGSRAAADVEEARIRRCRAWARTLYRTRLTWRWATCLGGVVWVEQCGHRAAIFAVRDPSGAVHAAALGFVRELIGSEPLEPLEPPAPASTAMAPARR